MKDAADFLAMKRPRSASDWRTRAARLWRMTSWATSCPGLADALGWILLWRVVMEKRPGCDWIEACEEIRLPPRRFREFVLRLTGRFQEDLLDFDDWRALSPYRSIRTFGTATPRRIE